MFNGGSSQIPLTNALGVATCNFLRHWHEIQLGWSALPVAMLEEYTQHQP